MTIDDAFTVKKSVTAFGIYDLKSEQIWISEKCSLPK